MHITPTHRRWLSLAGSVAVIAVVLCAFACQRNETRLNAEDGDKSQAREWPLFGGTLQRNLVNTIEKNIADDWDITSGKEKNILWSENLGSKAYGGPTIGGGRIFLGTNNNRPRDKEVKGDKGVIMCFRESDGSFVWQIHHDKLPDGRVKDWPEEGICSSPVIKDGKIYYVSNRCEVVCATFEGKVEWTYDMIGNLGVFPHNLATCSALLVGETLFVITSNGVDEGHINLPAPDAPSFIALSIKKDLKPKERLQWAKNYPGKKVMHGQWSNPVYTEVNGQAQIIFPGGDGYLYSCNPKDGEIIWKFDCNPKGSVYRLGATGTRNDFVCTPVIVGNYLYIGVGQDPEHKKGVGHLWCIDITKKPTNKDKDVSPHSDPKDEAPDKFDPKDPKNKDSALVWHYGGRTPESEEREYYFGRTMSTCAVIDGMCFAADFDGYLYCFDAKTGTKHWETYLGKDTWSSPYVVDGKVYIGNEDGAMHIFEAKPKMKLVRKVQMIKSGGRIRATPVACNGVLYVMTENPCKLWAIKAK